MRHACLALLLCLGLASSSLAQSQITTGVIQGAVMDSSGATLPGVNVEVRNTGTNLTRSIVTGSDGRFVFLQLPSGNYAATYTLQGFSTLVQDNIALTVGQAITLSATMMVSG